MTLGIDSGTHKTSII